jgi:acyl-CoA dehydrogenase
MSDRHSPFYDAEHRAFRESVAKYFEQSLSGSVSEQRQSGSIAGTDLTLAAEQGLLGINVPEYCGGAGVEDLRFPMVIVEEAMRIGAVGYALTIALQSMVVVPALTTDERLAGRSEILGGIAAGRHVVAVAGAHHPVPAAVDGDHIVLTGVAKSVVAAAIASHVLVGCKTVDGENLVVVADVADTGLCIAPAHRSLGANDAGVTDMAFDHMRILSRRVLRSADALTADLELLLAAVAIGGACAAFGWTADYAAGREVFGRVLSTFENTRYVMSRLAADLSIVQTSLRHALSARADGPLPASMTAALAVTATGLYSNTVDEGLQLHGGYGYMHEYPIAQAFADAEFLRLLVDRFEVTLRSEGPAGSLRKER